MAQMTDVGSELAAARERRGLSLNDLSRRTKINVATLQALERNDVAGLPGGIYTRGLLRACAREVGCDPEAIVSRFRAQCENEQIGAGEASSPSSADLNAVCEAGQVHSADIDAMDRKSAHVQALTGVVSLLCVGLLLFSFGQFGHPATPAIFGPRAADAAPSPPSPPASPSSLLSLSSAEAARVEVGTAGSPSPAGPSATGSGELRLDIQARGPCWLSGTADGQRVIYRLLDAGERTHIEAHEDIVLRVGDAASVEYTINGLGARPLGGPGQPVTIHLTRQNYREFLNP